MWGYKREREFLGDSWLFKGSSEPSMSGNKALTLGVRGRGEVCTRRPCPEGGSLPQSHRKDSFQSSQKLQILLEVSLQRDRMDGEIR